MKMAPNINYQPIMLIVLLQNDGKATREKIEDAIKKQHPDVVVEGNRNSPRTGSFEITINKQLVYSKFQTNDFPKEPEVLSWFESQN